MRPYDIDYDEFEDFDGLGDADLRSIRRMVNERQRDELRMRGRRKSKRSAHNQWHDDDWDSCDDYDDTYFEDYIADEFDAYSGLSIDRH